MTEAAATDRVVIIVAIDFSERSPAVYQAAERVASSGAELHLVTVIDESPPRTQSQIDKVAKDIDQAASKLRGWRIDHARTSVPAAAHVRVGDAAGSILQLAVDLDADLIVVGTEGREGIKRLMHSSVAEALVRHAGCPVLVVREKDFHGAEHSPQIEPPCPRCVETRQRTRGAQWWCDEHNKPHERPHRYGLSDTVADQMHDSNVIPTGVRFF
ncbi:MAG: universal stress protein [Polyangiales bacterium]